LTHADRRWGLPGPPGCLKLTGEENARRVRVGDYRILYEIFDGRDISPVLPPTPPRHVWMPRTGPIPVAGTQFSSPKPMRNKSARNRLLVSDEMKSVRNCRFESRDLLRVDFLPGFKKRDLLSGSIYFPC
jgi:hypothetical protein